ncbi:septum site-determining protein MinC [Oryzisolibacter sp. LB2S]|uniref:septum site-determining protein MinC n=1 Tax=Alicycliphilus soli TaxID=3228789 RepID=UPI00345916D1
MAVDTAGQARTHLDLKSAQLSVVALMLKTADVPAVDADLTARRANDPEFFDNDPLLIDLSAVQAEDQPIDFAALVQVLRSHRTQPVAVRGGSDAQMAAAHAAGLIAAPDAPAPRAQPRAQQPEGAMREVVREVVREVQVQVPVEVPVPAPARATLVVDKPLRSGQQVYARGSDLVVLAMVSFGAEVIADGNIHVYAPLRGRAIAGARGDTSARIFSTCLEPQLVSVAGIYRTTETELPDNVRGKQAQVRLDGEKLLIEPL